MICFNTKATGKKARYKCKSKTNSNSEDTNQGSKGKYEKPVAIYSRKFAESWHGDDKMFHNNKRAILYKTEMCRSFSETGTCRYGESCQFCHSESELRSVERHPKYKTEICRTFWLEGSCPYGKRCCFAHLDNADLIEKAKKLGAINKQKKPKEAEHAQLTTFSLSIEEDPIQTLCEESDASSKMKSRCENWQSRELTTRDILLYIDTFPIADIWGKTGNSKQISENLDTPDLFSNKTKFESASQSRNGSFTFNKYYSESFEPLAAGKFGKVLRRQNTWSLNELNKWKDDPLNFIPENRSRH
ncbi:hypothetical protein PAEPH01_0039 [Pancytospora epiphaga]|nr:hypothetical protein PAEPH01_0039 [Pancytospora epiphaga]